MKTLQIEESIYVVPGTLAFHHTESMSFDEIHAPSPSRPFFVSTDLQQSLGYSDKGNASGLIVVISPKANIEAFDLSNREDLDKTTWPKIIRDTFEDEEDNLWALCEDIIDSHKWIIECLSILDKSGEDAAGDWIDNEDPRLGSLDMSKFSVDDIIELVKWIKTSGISSLLSKASSISGKERQLLNYDIGGKILADVQQLGYAAFRENEPGIGEAGKAEAIAFISPKSNSQLYLFTKKIDSKLMRQLAVLVDRLRIDNVSLRWSKHKLRLLCQMASKPKAIEQAQLQQLKTALMQ